MAGHRKQQQQQTTTTQAVFPQGCPVLCANCENSFMLSNMAVDSAPGAAMRRRQRKLRQFLRHERLSVAMALAEFTHHTAPRRPTMARARGEESDEMNNAMGQKTPLPRAASTVYFSLDDDGDVLAARPVPLVEVRPLPVAQRHAAAHVEDIVPYVQILDVPVPQLGDRVVDLLRAGACRAGYRRAQDLSGPNPTAFCGLSSAEGRTVGGGAHDRVLLFSSTADCQADR